MLKSILRIAKDSSCCFRPLGRKILRFKAFRASLSTNTAINKSLRRSQDEYRRTNGRQPFRRPADDERNLLKRPYIGERTRRPNHQQGQDVQDIEQHTRINERYKALRDARTTRRVPRGIKLVAQESVAKGLTTDETLREQYDYTRKACGNRAARREAQFGRKAEPPLETAYFTASSHQAANRQTLRRNTEIGPPGRGLPGSPSLQDELDEGNRELSLPEDLRDEYPPRSSGRSFTMRRQAPDDRGFTGSSGSRGYGRDFSQNINQTARHRESDAPLGMPYTTPASEFLYGTSVVISALLSSRRKFYKLYIFDGDNREVRNQDTKVRNLALERNVIVQRVKGDWLQIMDKMSAGRPHNGYILEASPLPKLPVVGLQSVERRKGPFHVILDHQTSEDEEINGKVTNIEYEVNYPRYPFVLLLDGVLDPGNLGAILRTAFFLGVDAVAVASRSSAPISPVALKASAGASESLPLVSVNQPGGFLENCKKNGWKVFAATSPGSDKRPKSRKYLSTSNLGSPVRERPCILVLGSEGEGLRWDIQKKASFDVGIEGQRIGQGTVDSLNVSVAAGLLCEAFLRKPSDAEITVEETPDGLDRDNDVQRDTKNLLF